MALLLDIGGHILSVQGDCAERFLLDYDGGRPFIVDSGTPRWHVCYGCDLQPTAGAVELSRFPFREIQSECCFSRTPSAFEFVMYPDGGSQPLVAMRYVDGSDTVYASSCDDDSALRFSLWFAVTLLGASSQFTFIHSSVIVFGGRAVLFLGESGTGKSTHTRLWRENIPGARLLNDDSPALSVTPDGVVVHGSPWSGKTPCYVHRSFPLAAVVRLSQAPCNRIRRLSVPEAFAAVQPSLPPALMQDDTFADRMIEIVSGVISTVPVFHLECLPDAAAARLSCSTVFRPPTQS